MTKFQNQFNTVNIRCILTYLHSCCCQISLLYSEQWRKSWGQSQLALIDVDVRIYMFRVWSLFLIIKHETCNMSQHLSVVLFYMNLTFFHLHWSCLFSFALQAVIKRTAGPEGGAGEAGSSQPEAFSGKRAADVQAATQRLVLDHPPARHGAGDHTQMTAAWIPCVLHVHRNVHHTAAHDNIR